MNTVFTDEEYVQMADDVATELTDYVLPETALRIAHRIEAAILQKLGLYTSNTHISDVGVDANIPVPAVSALKGTGSISVNF
jgi:hypothetical protein